jgi:uncharacterized protein with PIN domain
MNLFFDTSALVKFFHEEEGTQAVTTLITPENNIWISELVRIEFTSALFRRFRNNDINDTQLNDAITGFKEEISFFNIEPLGQVIIKEAESLLEKYGKIQGLRTLDALHLGSFNLIAENDWFFVAADENLCKVTQLMGFQSINPLKFHDK